jgi:hypothetical protein
MARKEFETWENKNRSEIWINRTDFKGEIQSVRIPPGQRIEITTDDRIRYNQEAAWDSSLDWFLNGALSQVHLLDTAEDYEELLSNPNTKSESELQDLLKLNANELKKELAKITSPLVLQRLKAYVESDEVDKAENITVAKVKAVNARFEELNGSPAGKKFDSYEESISKPISISSNTVVSS